MIVCPQCRTPNRPERDMCWKCWGVLVHDAPAAEEETKVRGINGSLVAKADYDLTTRCAQDAWSHMKEFYGPDGIEQIRIGLSVEGVRRFTAAVLNSVEDQGYLIVPREESAR